MIIIIIMMIKMIMITIKTVKFTILFNSRAEPLLCSLKLFVRQRFDYFLGRGYNWLVGRITLIIFPSDVLCAVLFFS